MNSSKSFLSTFIIIVIILAVLTIYWSINRTKKSDEINMVLGIDSYVEWQFNGSEWEPRTDVEECEIDTIGSPMAIENITSSLYPGQPNERGYRSYAEFRFDESKNSEIGIRAPFDAYLFRGSRYFENGELQYILDFVSPCGLMYRLDHLSVLSSELTVMVEELELPLEGDKQFNDFIVPLRISKDYLIATSVGIKDDVSVDFGLYDLNEKNEISRSDKWMALEHINHETDSFGVCWLDYLPKDQKESLTSLAVNNESDYCKNL